MENFNAELLLANNIPRPIPMYGRRIGNSTRLVDYYVQLLFLNIKQPLYIKDHFAGEEEYNLKVHLIASDDLLRRIIDRLISLRVSKSKNIAFIGTYYFVYKKSENGNFPIIKLELNK